MRNLLIILLSLLAPAMVARSIDRVPNVHLADRTRYVADPDGYLSPTALARADSIIADIWCTSSAEVVAVIVDSTDDVDIDTYATELFSQWGVGKKDKSNGVLVLIAVDDRQVVIRTGYGAEGVLPDITCGKIIRNVMTPRFREGDYDGGVVNSLAAIHDIVTTPEATDELLSKYANDADADSDTDFFAFYIKLGIIALVVMLIVVISTYVGSRNLPRDRRYIKLRKLDVASLLLSVGFIGIPLVAWLLLRLLMHHVRRGALKCPNCASRMKLIDEVHDNDYLTPAQDMEERLNSVDYDVWYCPECSTTEIFPYENRMAGYTICPKCGARTDKLVSNVITRQPTTRTAGEGVRTYSCRNCGNQRTKTYVIPKTEPPVVIVSGGGGRGGIGGGGISGGSFGGGFTGGGGARGGW